MVELLDIIKGRRSIRRFKKKDVSYEVIKKLIEAAIWAPSACDMQDWRFVVIKDEKIKKEIYDLGGAVVIKDAPVCIIVCYDKRTDNQEYRDDIQSAAAAIQNMLLYAHALNLGACWINHLPTKKQLKKLLSINKNFDPIGAVIVGYAADKLKEAPRKGKVDGYISFNKFDFKIKSDKKLDKDPRKSYSRRIVRKIYYRLPKCIKIIIRGYVEKRVKKF